MKRKVEGYGGVMIKHGMCLCSATAPLLNVLSILVWSLPCAHPWTTSTPTIIPLRFIENFSTGLHAHLVLPVRPRAKTLVCKYSKKIV